MYILFKPPTTTYINKPSTTVASVNEDKEELVLLIYHGKFYENFVKGTRKNTENIT